MSITVRQRDEIFDILIGSLPWSPFDFIKDISITGDREMYARQLTAERSEIDDLSFVHSDSKAGSLAVFAERLPWDSEFFGYGIAQLNGVFPISKPFSDPKAKYSVALSRLVSQARDRGISYLFAKVDPRDLATLRALGQLGFAVIETRLYYHRNLSDFQPAERYPVRPASQEDIPSLARTAQDMVNRFDRFHADPAIDSKDADRLMARWVEASIMEGFADVTVVPDAPQPTAFLTVRYHQDKWPLWGLRLSQAVFGAVGPNYKGWYRKIISEINCHLKDVGVEHTFMVSQATNKAVIIAWETLGYRFGKSELVLRALL